MQRFTISIDEETAERFDRLIRDRGYQSRSEAVRDLLRDALVDGRTDDTATGQCVANLSYVFDRRTRSLAQRLSELDV